MFSLTPLKQSIVDVTLSPHLSMGPLRPLIELCQDVELVRFVQTCSILYTQEYPILICMHNTYELIMIKSMNPSRRPIFKKIIWTIDKSIDEKQYAGLHTLLLNKLSKFDLTSICNLSHLQSVTIQECSFTSTQLQPLMNKMKTNKSILQFGILNCYLDAAICISTGDMLKENKSLETLMIAKNILDRHDAEALRQGLIVNKTLKYVNLMDNTFDDESLFKLTTSLQTHPSIQELCIQSNECRIDAWRGIVNLLGSNTCLTSFNMSQMRLCEDQMIFICLVLGKTPLQILDISNNNLKKEGTNAIILYLKHPTPLTSLYVNNTQLYAPLMDKFCNALQFQTSLTVLDLSRNKLKEEGIKSIASVLDTNKILKDLSLSKSFKGLNMTAIFDAVKKNTTLKYLDVSKNEIESTHEPSITSMLKDNKTLTYLDLSENVLTDPVASIFYETMSYNRTIRVLKLEGNYIGFSYMNLIFDRIHMNSLVEFKSVIYL